MSILRCGYCHDNPVDTDEELDWFRDADGEPMILCYACVDRAEFCSKCRRVCDSDGGDSEYSTDECCGVVATVEFQYRVSACCGADVIGAGELEEI